jgi:hypothetical protein
MVHGGRILEFTYVGVLVPPFASGHGQIFHPRNPRPVTYNELTCEMALNSHILFGTMSSPTSTG